MKKAENYEKKVLRILQWNWWNTPYITVKGDFYFIFYCKGEILGGLGENFPSKIHQRGRDGSGAYLAVDLVEVYVSKKD